MYRDMLILPYDNRFLYMLMLKCNCKCKFFKNKFIHKRPLLKKILKFFVEETNESDKYLVYGVPKTEDSKKEIESD